MGSFRARGSGPKRHIPRIIRAPSDAMVLYGMNNQSYGKHQTFPDIYGWYFIKTTTDVTKYRQLFPYDVM